MLAGIGGVSIGNCLGFAQEFHYSLPQGLDVLGFALPNGQNAPIRGRTRAAATVAIALAIAGDFGFQNWGATLGSSPFCIRGRAKSIRERK